MQSCLMYLKNTILKCLIFLRILKQRTDDQDIQLAQYKTTQEQNDQDQGTALKEEINSSSYQDESFLENNEAKVDFNEFENKANFQDCEQQQNCFDDEEIRSFIEDVPNLQLNDQELYNDIGCKAVKCFLNVVNSMEGYEKLEDGQDDFVFWVKYYETSEKFQISIMKYTYTLPTTLNNYLAFIRDLDLQKQLDNSIFAYENHYESDNCQVNYLRYKKILFMDPRDFLILKYYDRRDENTCVEISKSIIIDGLKPRVEAQKNSTRATLLLSGNILKQIDDNKLEVTTYSECNMKLKLKPVMTKNASKNEIKKMVKKYRDHFNQN